MFSSYICCKLCYKDSDETRKFSVQNTESEFYFSDQKNKASLCSIHPLKTPPTLIFIYLFVNLSRRNSFLTLGKKYAENKQTETEVAFSNGIVNY